MGTYTTWDFYEQFGGWPDPDEAVPSLEAIDAERKRRREEGDDPEGDTSTEARP